MPVWQSFTPKPFMLKTLYTDGQAPVANRFHVKSRKGCQSCKARKVKCDEKRPVCGNCRRYFTGAPQCIFRDLAPTVVEPKAKVRGEVRGAQRSGMELAWEDEIDCGVDCTNFSGFQDNSVLKLWLPRSIDDELADPFQTYPSPRGPVVDALLKYYFTSAVYRTFPWQAPSSINPTVAYYVPLIYTDEVLFRTVLQHTATQLEMLGSPTAKVLSRRFTGECIRLLQQRIQDPDLAVSNETLAAVANLAAVEHRRGNLKALRTHVEGLRRMIILRGGMGVVRRECAMVANAVFWVFAVSMYEIPFFTPGLEPFDHDPQWLIDAKELYWDASQLQFESLDLDPSVAKVLSDVRVLSLRYTLPPTYSSPMEAASVLTHLCRQLYCILSRSDIGVSSTSSSVISQACQYAVAIHVFSPWRGLHPDPTLVVNEMLHSLKACLRRLMTSSINQVLILWLFAVGGVAASDVPERQWFISHLVVIVGDMGLENWEDMKSQLVKVIWHQRLCEDPHRKLWNEVMRKQKDLNISGIAPDEYPRRIETSGVL